LVLAELFKAALFKFLRKEQLARKAFKERPEFKVQLELREL
jgi:hypothetical protein